MYSYRSPNSSVVLRRDAPRILDERVARTTGARSMLRNSGLALANGRKTEQKACQGRTCSIVVRGLGGEAVGELVIAAILEEAPHGPDVPAIASAKFQAVAATLPAEGVPAFEDRVPGVHRRGGEMCRRNRNNPAR